MTRPKYGFDAPPFLFGLSIAALLMVVAAIIGFALGGWVVGLWPLLFAVYFAVGALLYLHATRWGKFAVWDEVLDGLALRGDEDALDLGCGRGAVLIAVARRLTTGRASGADLWRSTDQSGNAEKVTRANAEAAGVSDRIGLDTADMTALPYPDESFDLVVSSLAIHNIHPAPGRLRALDEALRVLRPGGRLVIADINAAPAYRTHLVGRGLSTTLRPLGWRMWYGGPWVATTLVTTSKP
ncbi:MAG TPA: class I SAM-dependent methyltransferase [Actinoplanes sp.]|jgi:ubiquinone/menaquinone biosynthesis C-methylase UbiE